MKAYYEDRICESAGWDLSQPGFFDYVSGRTDKVLLLGTAEEVTLFSERTGMSVIEDLPDGAVLEKRQWNYAE